MATSAAQHGGAPPNATRSATGSPDRHRSSSNHLRVLALLLVPLLQAPATADVVVLDSNASSYGIGITSRSVSVNVPDPCTDCVLVACITTNVPIPGTGLARATVTRDGDSAYLAHESSKSMSSAFPRIGIYVIPDPSAGTFDLEADLTWDTASSNKDAALGYFLLEGADTTQPIQAITETSTFVSWDTTASVAV